MARQIQPSDGGMINYNNIPLCPSLRDFTIGGKVRSIGWLHPPNFLSKLYGGETRMEGNALSRRQFRQIGFDESQYEFNQQCGVFVATIDCKRWGKRKKLITYMTFADGRKIVAPTWPRSRNEGLADMEVGCRIRVTYDKNRAGTLCVRRVERLPDYIEQKVLCSIMIPKSRL